MIYKAVKYVNNYEAIKSTQYLTSKTFYPSDEIQEWIVPEGVTKVHIDCVASKGKNEDSNQALGGKGGRVECDLTVTPHQKYYIVVGRIPENNNYSSYNASDIRTNNSGIIDSTSLSSRLIVAGGGGCAGNHSDPRYNYPHDGGDGGNIIGGDASSFELFVGGKGGTTTSGGFKGESSGGSTLYYSGSDGYFGLGGFDSNNNVAIGGSGWFGGGSGCAVLYSYAIFTNYYYSGGGGGSSYTDSSLCSDVTHTQGYNNGEGYITISAIDEGDYIEARPGYTIFKE